MEGIGIYLLIFLALTVIILPLSLTSEFAQKRNDKINIKKQALNLMGEDIDVKLLDKDEGAKLAYKGIVQYLRENFQNAANYFEEALKLPLPDDNLHFCFVWLLRCYGVLDYKKTYEKTLSRMLQALPTDDEVLSLNGTYHATIGEYEKAVYYFEQAIKYNPNYYSCYEGLGQIATDRAEYEKAIGYYDIALKINENSVFCICQKAVCYAALGDFETADSLMIRAATFNCDDFELIKNKLELIKEIKSSELRKEQTVD